MMAGKTKRIPMPNVLVLVGVLVQAGFFRKRSFSSAIEITPLPLLLVLAGEGNEPLAG